MILPPPSIDEEARLLALKEYSLLDSLPEQEYDEITQLASEICQTPISLISLIDDQRQWFKSKVGLDAPFTPREWAFCAHAINDKERTMVVQDSRRDERFMENPLVVGDPHVIFYAGVPLVNKEGHALGTLCVIDNEPRKLSESQLKALKTLGKQVVRLFELRKRTTDLRITISELKKQNQALNDFAHIAAHDIKSPLSNIIALSNLMETRFADAIGVEGMDIMGLINKSTNKLNELIDGILKYSQSSSILVEGKEEFYVKAEIIEIQNMVSSGIQVNFETIVDNNHKIFTNKIAFEQIMLNLISNAVKYNDKDVPKITIKVEDQSKECHLTVTDNGPGIKPEFMDKIFNIFETTNNRYKSGGKGTGIGLATVKSLVEGLNGRVEVSSRLGMGTTFTVIIPTG